jgi:hypothetical protein
MTIRDPGTSRLVSTDGRVSSCLATSALFLAGPSSCGSEEGSASNGDASGPLYAVMFEVYDDVGSTSYLRLLDTLDIEEIDESKAIEYGRGPRVRPGVQRLALRR